jgi:hypothetical protein
MSRTGTIFTALMLALGGAGLAAVAIPQAAPANHDAARPGARAAVQKGASSTPERASVALVSAAAALGTTCHPAISGSGNAKFQNNAENNAKGDWQNVANGTYPGGPFDWTKAAGHAMSCRHNGLGPLQRRWTCTATAQPCYESLTCKPGYIQVQGGSAKLQSGAQTNAENQWQHDAGNAYGTAFKYWGNAANKSMSCWHNGLGPIQRRWRCTARGRPCG